MCDHDRFETWVRSYAENLGLSLVLESYSFREMAFTASLGAETPVEYIAGIRGALNNAAPSGTHVIVVIRDEDELVPAPEPTSGPSRFARVEPV